MELSVISAIYRSCHFEELIAHFIFMSLSFLIEGSDITKNVFIYLASVIYQVLY